MRLTIKARMTAVLACLGACASVTLGQDVTRPGNTIVGVGGTTYGAGETPVQAIDDSAASKYLNFAISNTGFLVTPTGTGIVQALTIITANDQPPRDPFSFTLEGTNDGTNFTLIASGPLNPPTARFAFYQAIFPNSATYTQYRVIFPMTRNPSPTANSMQVAEVQLNTFGNILSAGDAITATLSPPQSYAATEGPAGLIDGTLTTKFNVANGNAGPVTVNITPAVGTSIITGIDLFGVSDDATNPNRTPPKMTISGSNDGITYTPIGGTISLAQPTLNYQDQQFTFANTISYTRYRLVFNATTAPTMQFGEIQLLGTTLGAAPANDLCANAQAVTNGSTSGSTFFATGADESSCGVGDAVDVWYKYTATFTGLTEANTCGAGTLDTVLSVYTSCGGAEIGCNDNACLGKSRVRFNTVTGQQYLIRVAGVGGDAGSFTLNLVPNPVLHNDVPVTLTYNFNGIVHPGESGIPDDPNGYRSLSDRGFRLTGTPGSIDTGLEGTGGIPYSIASQPFVVDMVMIGNRNTVNTGLSPFDATADGDNFGIQPDWLPNVDLTGIQTTQFTGPALAMGANTSIGTIFHATNGGNTVTVTLGFTDSTSVQVNISAPDWFGVQTVAAPAAGVATQVSLGTFFGAGQTDQGLADTDLNLVEAVISTASLIAGGKGDMTGKQLASIAFSNRTNTNSDVGIFAVTVRDAAASATVTCCDTTTGACSTSIGTCSSGTLGTGSTCTTSSCPAAGACCTAGVCAAPLTSTACTGGGGLYQGDNGTCSPDPCGSSPTGACCNGAGGCSLQTATNCTTPAGAFQGAGSACIATNCGVCCRGSTCVTSVFTAAACASSLPSGAAAGSSYVANTACGGTNHKIPCCYADYNKVGGKTVSDIFAYLSDWFAHSPYAFNGTPQAGNAPVSQIFAFLGDWFAGC